MGQVDCCIDGDYSWHDDTHHTATRSFIGWDENTLLPIYLRIGKAGQLATAKGEHLRGEAFIKSRVGEVRLGCNDGLFELTEDQLALP